MFEQRWFKVMVRPAGAIGSFYPQIFCLTVPVTGSYHAMSLAVIQNLQEQGLEIGHIVSNSIKRNCL